MFNWQSKNPRYEFIYNQLTLSELNNLCKTSKQCMTDVLDYLSDPARFLRVLNGANPIDIQEFIATAFQPDSEAFKQLKQSISIAYLQSCTHEVAVNPSKDAICCYLLIADRSPEFSLLDIHIAYHHAIDNKYQHVADSLKIIENSVDIPNHSTQKKITTTNTTYANLSFTNFYLGDLKDAALLGANLKGANLQDACLENANLTKANLTNTNLANANIKNANFTGATLTQTHFFTYDQTNNHTLLNFQLDNWHKQLVNHLNEKELKHAMLEDLIAIANKLNVSEGRNLLLTANKHAIFHTKKHTFTNITNSIFDLFCADYQKTLTQAIAQLEQSNKFELGHDHINSLD